VFARLVITTLRGKNNILLVGTKNIKNLLLQKVVERFLAVRLLKFLEVSFPFYFQRVPVPGLLVLTEFFVKFFIETFSVKNVSNSSCWLLVARRPAV
jgi:hypothetical protein